MKRTLATTLGRCRRVAAPSRGLGTAAGAAGLSPFHLAVPVRCLEETRDFYVGKLGCEVGRSCETWVDFSLFGHQVVAHRVEGYCAANSHNAVDGDDVPVPHFGVVLTTEQFDAFVGRATAAGLEFVIEPRVRHRGLPGEQKTCFFLDPSSNAIELKAMTNPDELFARF